MLHTQGRVIKHSVDTSLVGSTKTHSPGPEMGNLWRGEKRPGTHDLADTARHWAAPEAL